MMSNIQLIILIFVIRSPIFFFIGSIASTVFVAEGGDGGCEGCCFAFSDRSLLGGEGEVSGGDEHFGSFSFVGGVDVCCCWCCFGDFGLEEWKGSWLVLVWKDSCTAV